MPGPPFTGANRQTSYIWVHNAGAFPCELAVGARCGWLRAITPLPADGSIWCQPKRISASRQQGSGKRFRKCCQTMIIILAGGGANHYISRPIISTTFFLPLSSGHCYSSFSDGKREKQSSLPQFTKSVIGRTCRVLRESNRVPFLPES